MVEYRNTVSKRIHWLHWLPVHQRIVYKTAFIMYKTVSTISPYYLSSSLDLSGPKRKELRSQHHLNIPRTFKKAGDQAFSVAGPCVFLFRSGTLNLLIILKCNLKHICILHKCCFYILLSSLLAFMYFVHLVLFCFMFRCFVTFGKGAL